MGTLRSMCLEWGALIMQTILIPPIPINDAYGSYASTRLSDRNMEQKFLDEWGKRME